MPESSVEDPNMKNGGKSNRNNTAPIESQNKQETQCGHSSAVSRRQFLETAAGASILASFPSYSPAAEAEGEVPRRTLGRTGEKISMVGLGGFHLGKPELPESESTRVIRTAIDNGINFLDNCWDYNGGESEIRMGNALRGGYRQRAFLMSKIDGRNKAAAASQINESLRRLQTDGIDLP